MLLDLLTVTNYKPNCELFRKSFMYSGAAISNSLPLHLKMQLRLTLINVYI